MSENFEKIFFMVIYGYSRIFSFDKIIWGIPVYEGEGFLKGCCFSKGYDIYRSLSLFIARFWGDCGFFCVFLQRLSGG